MRPWATHVLASRNYRLFFVANSISIVGTSIQPVAMALFDCSPLTFSRSSDPRIVCAMLCISGLEMNKGSLNSATIITMPNESQDNVSATRIECGSGVTRTADGGRLVIQRRSG
jgi:hypothetical protein